MVCAALSEKKKWKVDCRLKIGEKGPFFVSSTSTQGGTMAFFFALLIVVAPDFSRPLACGGVREWAVGGLLVLWGHEQWRHTCRVCYPVVLAHLFLSIFVSQPLRHMSAHMPSLKGTHFLFFWQSPFLRSTFFFF